ncbi:hypothetical protein DMB42_01550 [Nonomuraea sp. WAC 01424]|uniref:hypothetical protein n=1 Tax=Nonomuraea sp. WAC 01424 TaxID=2203200 RepID=UPI000F769F2F|nr:hypothetical protein [Nonomuraea sp. WAC 01424]RSN15543.1 hypothetical protein DMB42_01550 [Nonomuraea sp. WAC 01424]
MIVLTDTALEPEGTGERTMTAFDAAPSPSWLEFGAELALWAGVTGSIDGATDRDGGQRC